MMDVKLKKAVLKRIKPTDQKLRVKVDRFLKKLNDLLGKHKAEAMIGGSIAKDTYLEGDHDCDIFVRFDYETYKDKDISKILGRVLSPLKPELVHGSRDYYFVKKQVNYEIVPVIHIDDPTKALNVTDMSPLHVEWVKKHPGFEDEIRLAKQFCKAAKVYGAESFIRGFSGHVLDILVIHHGGFENFLKKAVRWKDKEVIDPDKHHKKDALKNFNKSKIEGPIIVVDPALPERNAAAALSYEKFERFKKAAHEFLKSPDKKFFEIKYIEPSDLVKRKGKNKLIMLEATPLPGKTDIVGAKLLKALELIRNQLKFCDFIVKEVDWEWDKKGKALFWFLLDPKDLFPITKWPGPPLVEKERVKSFKQKHKKTFIEKGRIYSYVKRKYVGADDLIKDLLKDPLLKQKVKSIKLLKEPSSKKKSK